MNSISKDDYEAALERLSVIDKIEFELEMSLEGIKELANKYKEVRVLEDIYKDLVQPYNACFELLKPYYHDDERLVNAYEDEHPEGI